MKKLYPIIVIIGLFVIVLGIISWQQQSPSVGVVPEGEEQNQVTQPPSLVTQSNTPAPLLTTDWRTYRNNDYNFIFKYPPTWKIKENYDSDEVLLISDISYLIDARHFTFIMEFNFPSIESCLEDLINYDDYKLKGMVNNEKHFIISGYSAYQHDTRRDGERNRYLCIHIDPKSSVQTFNITGNINDKTDDLFDLIISTLGFI